MLPTTSQPQKPIFDEIEILLKDFQHKNVEKKVEAEERNEMLQNILFKLLQLNKMNPKFSEQKEKIREV